MTAIDDVRHQVLAIFGRGVAELRETAIDGRVITAVAKLIEPREDHLCGFRIHFEHLANSALIIATLMRIAVDPDQHALYAIEALLALTRALRDPTLDIALLDRFDDSAIRIDLMHYPEDSLLHFVGEVLDVMAATQRIDGPRDPALMRDDLLRAQCDLRAFFGRDLKCLIEGSSEDRLRTAHHRRHRFDRDAHDVVVRLGGGQRRAPADHAETEQAALRVGAVTLFHQARPNPPGSAKFADLFEEIGMNIEEETEAARETIEIGASTDQLIDVGQAVGHRKRHLLDRVASGVAHVRARDAYGIEARCLLIRVEN